MMASDGVKTQGSCREGFASRYQADEKLRARKQIEKPQVVVEQKSDTNAAPVQLATSGRDVHEYKVR